MARERYNKDVWRQWGFEHPPSQWMFSEFIADSGLVAAPVFIDLIHEFAERVPLDNLFRIDGTDILADHRDDDGWNCNPTEDDYYGYGRCAVT